MLSKIHTAPWVGLPGEFEPGAQRWTQYDCVLLGDPALKIRTSGTVTGTPVKNNFIYFSLFPNPTHGILNISYSLPEASNVNLQILNTTGEEVWKGSLGKEQTSGKHQFSVDLGNLSSGIYYCRIVTSMTSQTKKLVIIH